MSSARTRTGADQGIYLGDTIAAEMRAARLPLEPRQFEFWFAVKNGRNAALTAAVNDIQNRNGALTGPDIDRLHELYLSPWRMGEKPDAIALRMSAKLAELAGSLESAIGAAQAQRETFSTEAGELSVATALTLHEVLGAIGRLAQSNREGQARYALLEARVDTVGREIGALQQQLAAVRADCTADPTTALPGRTAFNTVLANALGAATEARQPMALVLCDLDYFTAFNENFGSAAGDQVLRSIGMLFKAHLRPDDMVARFESDQYAAIMPRARAADAIACAERFRQMLMRHELFPHPNGAGRLTVSLGVADAIKGDTPEFLLRRAANALKIAKREGRNRVVEMTPDGPVWDAERRA
jgi:diguanylate cyclase